MELARVGGLFRRRWDTQPLESWAEQLKDVCGAYEAVPVPDRRQIMGGVRKLEAAGVECAQVPKDLSAVERLPRDIRRGESEHLFLIIQLSGRCGIAQSDRRSILAPGDCILVDSTKPSHFEFAGQFSNQISVHLPRQTMFSEKSMRFEVATRLAGNDPMAVALRSLVAKLLASDTTLRKTDHLRSLLYDATRLSFMREDFVELVAAVSGAHQRVELILDLIDSHLTDPELGPKWLAGRLKVSLRTLQDDFQATGATCTAVIREKRLRLAAQMLDGERNAKKGKSIAEIAFSCGFNDISYFNRSFREVFNTSPSDYLRNGDAVRRSALLQ